MGIFLSVVILAACDFWTVKNVSGRLLVGLRWWTTIDAEGNEKWFFESHDTKVANSPFDSTVFWYTQIGSTGLWGFFLAWKLLTILQLGLFWVLSPQTGRALHPLLLLLRHQPLRLLQVQQRYPNLISDYNNKLKNTLTNISSKYVSTSLITKYGLGMMMK